MKYTHESITEILKNYSELQEQVAAFVNKGYDPKSYSWSRARLNHENFTVEREENTACNCHPEYEWVTYSTIESFLEWYETQQVVKNSTKA